MATRMDEVDNDREPGSNLRLPSTLRLERDYTDFGKRGNEDGPLDVAALRDFASATAGRRGRFLGIQHACNDPVDYKVIMRHNVAGSTSPLAHFGSGPGR